MALTGFRLILLICLFVSTCFYITARQTALRGEGGLLATALTTSSTTLEGSAQEAPRQIQPLPVDAMRQTGADMPLNGHAGSPQNTAGLGERLHGNDVVAVAVNEQHGGTGSDVGGQILRSGEQAGKADNAGKGARAAKSNVKRHHGALAKPHKRKRIVRKAKGGKLAVKKRGKPRPGLADAAPAFVVVTEG